MRQPVLLWVDLTIASRQAELPAVFTESCDIRVCPKANDVFHEIERGGIDAVCFDMDYPDRHSLDLLKKVKSTFPSLPVLFATLQHSESLAVWAFRSRVLDYLVKPVSRRELERSLQILRSMSHAGRIQRGRKLLEFSPPMPPDVPHRKRSGDSVLMPALHHVQQNFREKIRSEDVARTCGMTTFRFSRTFRALIGITFQDYLLRYRILEACCLLRNPGGCVTEVAFSVGFNDASYFARMFRRFVGMSPSVYRTQCDLEQSELKISSLRSLLKLPDPDLPNDVRVRARINEFSGDFAKSG